MTHAPAHPTCPACGRPQPDWRASIGVALSTACRCAFQVPPPWPDIDRDRQFDTSELDADGDAKPWELWSDDDPNEQKD